MTADSVSAMKVSGVIIDKSKTHTFVQLNK